MKLDLLEVKGIYELRDKSIIETINRVFYEDGDIPTDVISQMVLLQGQIKSELETADDNGTL